MIKNVLQRAIQRPFSAQMDTEVQESELELGTLGEIIGNDGYWIDNFLSLPVEST